MQYGEEAGTRMKLTSGIEASIHILRLSWQNQNSNDVRRLRVDYTRLQGHQIQARSDHSVL